MRWIIFAGLYLFLLNELHGLENCGKNSFACKESNQCIDEALVCDGVKNCLDGSDEAASLCNKSRSKRSEKTCIIPPPPGNSTFRSYACENDTDCLMKQVGDEVPSGFKLEYTCLPGFSLVGHSGIDCRNGSWEPEMPHCSSPSDKKCIIPFTPSHGSFDSYSCGDDIFCNLNKGRRVSSGFRLHYKCSPGYNLIGSPDITCVSGSWVPQMPVCSLPSDKNCKLPPIPDNSTWILSSCGNDTNCHNKQVGDEVPLGFIIDYICSPGFRLIGYPHVQCDNGSWYPEIPQCSLPSDKKCNIPQIPLDGSFSSNSCGYDPECEMAYRGPVPTGFALSLECNGDATLMGSSPFICRSGSWFPGIPYCSSPSKSQCRLPPQPANGSYIGLTCSVNDNNCLGKVGELVNPGFGLFYSCEPGFKLRGGHDAHCISNYWLPRLLPNCTEFFVSSSEALDAINTLRSFYETNSALPLKFEDYVYELKHMIDQRP